MRSQFLAKAKTLDDCIELPGIFTVGKQSIILVPSWDVELIMTKGEMLKRTENAHYTLHEFHNKMEELIVL